MSDNQACCAHSRVVLKHTDYPDGTRSDYWECDSGCGQRFHADYFNSTIHNLRDWFAGMAMQGMLAANAKMHEAVTDKNVDAVIAREAYLSADAMIAEKNKPNEQTTTH